MVINNNEILNINNKIYCFLLFSKEGLCVLETQQIKLFTSEEHYHQFKLLLKNICYHFFKNNKKYENFTFETLIVEKFKVTILLKQSLALIGIFPLLSSKSYQKMLLIHLFIALINYKGDSVAKIDAIGEKIKFDKNNLESIKLLFNNYNNDSLYSNSVDNNDLLELLIFQQYFLNLLFSHFINVYNIIFKRESLNLGGIKLKNLYILDASTQSILFDLKKAQNRKNNLKYYNNELLMKEILFQSNVLYQYYLNTYKNNGKAKTKYLLFECTSAFPRLLFIFKFIPVLKGLIMIHLYKQRKLSRKIGNDYHEIELIFCSPENKNKNSQEFQYCEPKKLVIINKFLEEFYLTSRKADLFRIVSNDKKFKYFNYLAVNAINGISMKDSINNDIDAIFNIINDKIKEQIIENKKSKKLENNIEESSFDKILDVDISNIYKELYDEFDIDSKHGKENNIINYEFPDSQYSDINPKKDDNKSNNYVLTKRSISIIFDDNLSDTKTKYYNHLENININNNINSTKKSKDIIIDKEITDSMNLTNIDLITKIYENSNNVTDNFSLISAVDKASNNNLKEVEIHKNKNYSSSKKKVKSNINILDLLDYSNIKSANKNSAKKIVQESEENRLDDLSDDNDVNNEQMSVTKLKIDNGNNKESKKARNKLAILDADKIKIKSPLKISPLN